MPKAGGQTRLIFHLSYDFGELESQKSVNYHTPDYLCSVKYCDLDHAIQNSLDILEYFQTGVIYYGKSDIKSAFRILPLNSKSWPKLIYKAKDLSTGFTKFFVEKNLPFGSSQSCALFQKFSDSLKHIVEHLFAGNHHYHLTNYLDDYLFCCESKEKYNQMVRCFLQVCEHIKCPTALEKTEWADSRMVFLSILLDGFEHKLVIPEDKRLKALTLLNTLRAKKSATVRQIQQLTGTLNFLVKSIFAGWAFTRRMYAKYSEPKTRTGKPLQQYHHVRLDKEFKSDCSVWSTFLQNTESKILCTPFTDINRFEYAESLSFFSDAAKNSALGFGCFLMGSGFFPNRKRISLKNVTPVSNIWSYLLYVLAYTCGQRN